MKHTDISKVKVGDLWVRGEAGVGSPVVIGVAKKTIDLYDPEGTEDYEHIDNVIEVLDDWKIRVSKRQVQLSIWDDGFYFES